ncbi:nuclease-related domain-containing protein [Bacillus massilinigeriensis]|uniref:nuclease-related domain-containing protein n=1 Tax=Bacillus mediterraneensis TaxID=1805474 RepID=UPI0008F97240|nr:nuclease-related domain-containing protein [Bacillus mediterraneensis]
MFLNFLFKNKKSNNSNKDMNQTPNTVRKTHTDATGIKNERIAVRKGELGEYKIDIQLSQMPKEYMYLNDLLVKNPKSSTGYSQIDHIIITPYGLFVIETKNYQGTIYGGKDRKAWLINGKFKMMNPLMQNYGHIQALKNFIDGKYHQYFVSIVSFTKRCTFKIEEELRKIHSNQLVIYDVELTEFINRKVAVLKLQYKKPILMEDDIELIYNSLLNSNILDESIRKQHIGSIQLKKNNIDKTTDENKCVICQKPVSEKVKSFCLSNKKFQGKVYCYDHQKTL